MCKLLVPTPITRSVSSYGLLRQKQKGGAPFQAPDLKQLSVDHPRLSDSDSMAQVVSSTSSSQLFLFFIAGSSSSSRSHAPTGTNADCAVRSDSWLSCVFSKATGVFAVTGFFDGTHSCNCSKEIKETHAEFLAQGHRYTDTSSPSTWIMNNFFSLSFLTTFRSLSEDIKPLRFQKAIRQCPCNFSTRNWGSFMVLE